MSSIQKIKSKKTGQTLYKVCFELPRYNNKRRKSSHTFPPNTPYAEVKAFALEKDREYNNGKELLVENSDITFKELSEIYRKNFLLGKSPSTIEGYVRALENSKPYGILNYMGDVPVKKITLTFLQAYINELNRHLSSKSIKNYRMVLGSIMKLAVKLGIISKERNPVEDLIIPKVEMPEVEAYTEDEVKNILTTAKEDISNEAYLLLLFLFSTGCRRGEAAAITFDRVDFENSKITIAENKIVVDRQEYIKSPKTASGRREIFIPKILLDELKKAKRDYDVLKFKGGPEFVDSNCIFHKQDGSSYSPMGLSNIYWRFFKRHPELKRLKMHSCRHTFCSILLSNNVDVKTVQSSMGHKHLTTTVMTYAHAYESRKQAAANTLNNIFASDDLGA